MITVGICYYWQKGWYNWLQLGYVIIDCNGGGILECRVVVFLTTCVEVFFDYSRGILDYSCGILDYLTTVVVFFDYSGGILWPQWWYSWLQWWWYSWLQWWWYSWLQWWDSWLKWQSWLWWWYSWLFVWWYQLITVVVSFHYISGGILDYSGRILSLQGWLRRIGILITLHFALKNVICHFRHSLEFTDWLVNRSTRTYCTVHVISDVWKIFVYVVATSCADWRYPVAILSDTMPQHGVGTEATPPIRSPM